MMSAHFDYVLNIDTLMMYCPLITQTRRIISVRCFPPELAIKDTTLLIHSCQSVGTVNFALPFTTRMTLSSSILQTFHSCVATSHLRQPKVFLSHNSTHTPGLAPLMNVLFCGRCDFPISFSGRERLKSSLRKFYDRYGDLT